MRRTASTIALAGLLVFVAVGPARAQDSERAEELIRQANEYRRQGQDSSAIPLLRQAYKLSRSPRTAAQLGLAELALGYWIEAEQHLSESLVGSGNPWVERNRKVLESSLNTSRSHLANLTIEGEPAGAQVRVNGRSVGTFPLPAPIRVGEGVVTVDVEAGGRKSESRTVTVAGLGSQRLWFSLAAEATPSVSVAAVTERSPAASVPVATVEAKPGPPPAAGPPAWRRALPWTLGGAAALAAGFGVWQHVLWQKRVGDFDANDSCGRTKDMRGGSGCSGLYDSYKQAETRAFIGYGAAAALAAGATVFFVLDRDDGVERAIGPGPGTFGIAYVGSF